MRMSLKLSLAVGAKSCGGIRGQSHSMDRGMAALALSVAAVVKLLERYRDLVP